ncbi:MAG: DUF3047 domain-containing protein [Limnobacter sp.]|nr:DUF3047 domain-containing protein [Limnobacter sp.]
MPLLSKAVVACLAGLLTLSATWAQGQETDLGLFSHGIETQPPARWKPQFHPDIAQHTDLSLIRDEEELLLKVQSEQGYGSWAYLFDEPTQVETLSWLWRVQSHPSGADLTTQKGDDSAIKVCLFVDIDESRLSFGTRLALGAARTLSGESLPAATLCYQWSSRPHEVEIFNNPYTDRVRNVVLRSSPSGDIWYAQSRQVREDVIQAFGAELPREGGVAQVRLLGLAIGGDADNTQSSSLAFLKSLSLHLIGP